MIERIQIQNFQKHNKLRVTFDEKITTIVGPSDAGKSSVLRAIRWVAFNRPLGDGFIRHGEKSCSVKIWVDGHRIERKKAKGENVYLLDGKKLSAVGTEVPEAVQSCLSLSPENFQGQHDSPFWFSLTSGEVAKRLNSIVDLEVIDSSASWLAARLRKARVELEVTGKRLQTAVEEQQCLQFVPDLAKDFWAVKQGWMVVKATLERRDSLRDFLDKARQDSARAVRLQEAAKQVFPVEEAAKSLKALQERCGGLRRAIEKVKESEHMHKLMKMEAEDSAKELREKVGDVCPVCGGAMKWQ
jgi:exonuclease SbcC